MNKQILSNAVDKLYEEYLKILEDICNIENPTSCKEGVDASDVAAAGIPCMDNLGIRGGNSHSENEYAIKDSLKTSATQLAVIVANI